GPAAVLNRGASVSPSLGGGMGPSGPGWMGALAPTPELLAQVDRLAPIRDMPRIDVVNEARHDPRFSLRRFLRPYRRPLALGLILVILDALATLAGPYLIRQGIDHGVIAGSTGALFVASLVFLAVTAADVVDSIAETFVTGKTAERLLFALRIRIWAHLQRLSIDYYDKEMAGRIMTR